MKASALFSGSIASAGVILMDEWYLGKPFIHLPSGGLDEGLPVVVVFFTINGQRFFTVSRGFAVCIRPRDFLRV